MVDTVPAVPVPAGGVGASGFRCRKTDTPGKFTTSKAPGLIAVPPRATKSFLFVSTFFEFMCQWPMVTPASLNGSRGADAGLTTSTDAANIKIAMRFALPSVPPYRRPAPGASFSLGRMSRLKPGHAAIRGRMKEPEHCTKAVEVPQSRRGSGCRWTAFGPGAILHKAAQHLHLSEPSPCALQSARLAELSFSV